MFSGLAIITMIKYKIQIEYLFKNEKIQKRTQYSVNGFIVVLIVGSFLLPTLSVNKHVSNSVTKTLNILLQTSLLVSLSVASALNTS